MEKSLLKIYILDLCLNACESDLNEAKFDTPFKFIDEKKKFNFVKLPDIRKEKDKTLKNKDVDRFVMK